MSFDTATVKRVTRIFRYGCRDMADPNPALSPDEVVKHLAKTHPKLLGAKVVPGVIEGEFMVFELRAFGDKG